MNEAGLVAFRDMQGAFTVSITFSIIAVIAALVAACIARGDTARDILSVCVAYTGIYLIIETISFIFFQRMPGEELVLGIHAACFLITLLLRAARMKPKRRRAYN